MVRAATEIGLKTQLFGGAMVGMQYASLMQQLAEKLNRVVNYHLFVPSPKMNFPGIEDFLKKYQAQAKDAGVDPLGFYQPPFAYAAMQVLEQAIKATGSLNDDKLADYIHKNAFNTIVGEIRFNELGEWATARMLMVQFQNVQGSGLEQYMTGHKQVIVYPPAVQGRRAASAVREIAGRQPRAAARRCPHRRTSMKITAAVARERFGAFTIEELELTDPRPDEVLVKIVASGMCQTDLHGRDGYYDTPLSGGVRPRGRRRRAGGRPGGDDSSRPAITW